MGPVSARFDPAAAAPLTPLSGAITVAGLGLLAWGVTAEAHLGLGGSHLAALLLLVAACAGWLGWTAVRRSERVRGRASAAMTIGVMAAAGGALVPFAPLAVTFLAAAALGATIGWDIRTAGWVIGAGLAAMLVSVLASGHSLGVLSLGLGVVFAGTAVGLSRRESQVRATQAVLLSVERERADIERARAELLDDRNHLARELHDVLAHTLAALSLQLEALDVTVRASSHVVDPHIVEQVERTRRLVREGLAEARNAVRVLRDDLEPLPDQLAKLAADAAIAARNRRGGESLEPPGDARPLPCRPRGTDELHEARAGSGDQGRADVRTRAGDAVRHERTSRGGRDHVGSRTTRIQRQRLWVDGDRGAFAANWRLHASRPERRRMATESGGAFMRVLIADDQRVVRDGLATILGAIPDVEVVALAADGAEAVMLATKHRPDVVLMDLRMPHMGGVEATAALRNAEGARGRRADHVRR